MKFILETPAEEKRLTFEDVEINQFFVCDDGFLCQKVDEWSFNYIAEPPYGAPYADCCNSCDPNFIVKRILPKVLKIEF